MLHSEYDFDDSQPCGGDSGAPILWRKEGPERGRVLAMHAARRGDGDDDSVGPILWVNRGSRNAARQWLWTAAIDADGDGKAAADDNCDLAFNPNQENWNKEPGPPDDPYEADDVGDACDDSDADGITDADELANGTNHRKADTDDDGLSDAEERRLGTDPTRKDSDDDGLIDGDEVRFRTDPLVKDTDGDDLIDGDEVHLSGTSPTKSDTDDDLLTDSQELAVRLDPTIADTDGDGLIDGKDPGFIVGLVERLPAAAVKPSKNPIVNALEQAERKASGGDMTGASARLDFLLKKLDGCGNAPGNDDWVIVCSDQIALRDWIRILAANLTR